MGTTLKLGSPTRLTAFNSSRCCVHRWLATVPVPRTCKKSGMNPSNPASMACRTSTALSTAGSNPARLIAGIGIGRSRSCPPVSLSAADIADPVPPYGCPMGSQCSL
jgi:hypothetical protein